CFFFQAEDGIRDWSVTGVQTCALPIYSFGGMMAAEEAANNPRRVSRLVLLNPIGLWRDDAPVKNWMVMPPGDLARLVFADPDGEIGRASCRERVWRAVGGGGGKKEERQ